MRYQVLLVDDELPALRFVQSIIDKYLPDFSVAEKCTSAEAALRYLQDHSVDVLITDITMGKMNGIELAKQARNLLPDLCIVIISGYGEFEYAQGAIEASVASYILKPVSIPRVRQTLEEIRDKLDLRLRQKAGLVLPAVACDRPVDPRLMTGFAHCRYRFAYLQWGGTEPRLPVKLVASSLVQPVPKDHWVLRGRTEDEHIVIYPDIETDAFLSELSVCMSSRPGYATWTAIWQPESMPLTALHMFIRQAIPMLPVHTVIGKHRILSVDTKQ